MKLIIGNKNYSSWSHRPWLLLKEKAIPFEEVRLSFNDPEFHRKVAALNPAGRVPVLIDGTLTVWDSLAIIEYLAEKFPEKGIWPKELPARTRARSLCAELHAGFMSLRRAMPVSIEANLPGMGWSLAVQRDVNRIAQAFTAELSASKGPFLFGAYSAVDAYYTPIAARLRTYAVKLDGPARAYVDQLLSTASFRQLEKEARAEKDFYPPDELYRAESQPE